MEISVGTKESSVRLDKIRSVITITMVLLDATLISFSIQIVIYNERIPTPSATTLPTIILTQLSTNKKEELNLVLTLVALSVV